MEHDAADRIRALQGLDGAYGHGAWNTWFLRIYAALLVAIPWGVVRHRAEEGMPGLDAHDAGLWISAFAIALALWAWRESRMRFQFNLGVLSKRTPGGKVLWERDLANLVEVSEQSGRAGDFLVLQWQNGRKLVPLSGALEKALEEQMRIVDPGRRDSSEVPEEDATSESSDAVASGPAWRCAKCGEENPGNFDMCWKCETMRP